MRIRWWSGDLAEDHVTRGAAFLDRQYPGWEWDVMPATINLRSDEDCVLGQLARIRLGYDGFGGCWSQVTREMQITDTDGLDWAYTHGFLIRRHVLAERLAVRRQSRLELAWAREIMVRRAEKPRITVSPEVATKLKTAVAV
jgi:hypothetical protein